MRPSITQRSFVHGGPGHWACVISALEMATPVALGDAADQLDRLVPAHDGLANDIMADLGRRAGQPLQGHRLPELGDQCGDARHATLAEITEPDPKVPGGGDLQQAQPVAQHGPGALIVMPGPYANRGEDEFASAGGRSALESGPDRPHKIIHVDMDAFYASIEQRDNPPYMHLLHPRRILLTSPNTRSTSIPASSWRRRSIRPTKGTRSSFDPMLEP